MKVFFDNNTPPVLATTLHGFIQHDGHMAVHIRDMSGLPNGRHSSDIEWIRALQSDPDDWVFFTGDRRVTKNPAERAALRSAGLHGFILAPAYQKMPLNIVAATLVQRWPDILQLVQSLRPPSMHELPVGKNSRISQLPF